MAKRPKEKMLASRVDDALDSQVNAYLKTTDMNMADLVRKSVIEYMINHPAKKSKSRGKTDEPWVKALKGDE